ncbi:DUF3077 domain-containing protein [Pseudomonas sp. TH31]|nr:DUF3077 domain-containing protein [Pseudomonas sp. TH31]
MTDPSELKTIGLTPAIYCSNQAVFHVTRGVPLGDALAMASDFLFLAKALSKDAAYDRENDRHAWAAHYLTALSKALVDDVVKVLTRGPASRKEKPQNSGNSQCKLQVLIMSGTAILKSTATYLPICSASMSSMSA